MSAVAHTEELDWFLERASEFRASPLFDRERDQRTELAARARHLLDAAAGETPLRAGLDGLLELLSTAPWRTLGQWIEAWCSLDPDSLRQALLAFVDQQDQGAERRFESYVEVTRAAQKTHAVEWPPRITLLFGSLLNFALEPASLPIVRSNILAQLERVLGCDSKPAESPAGQYANHLTFARSLRSEMVRASIPARDMIDVEICLHSVGATLRGLPSLPRAAAIPEGVGLLKDRDWMMSLGERAALEGLLSQVKPGLAVEIGAARGGCLKRIAAHSEEVHALDLGDPPPFVEGLGNVRWHKGDSHVLLPQLLADFADQGRNVDFALVDGDHSPEGARRDIEDLLTSPAVRRTLIVAHDTMNESVRAGLEQVDYDGSPKVAYVELDFVPGGMYRVANFRRQLWGGLGLVVVDDASSGPTIRQDRYYEAQPLMVQVKEAMTRERDSGSDVTG